MGLCASKPGGPTFGPTPKTHPSRCRVLAATSLSALVLLCGLALGGPVGCGSTPPHPLNPPHDLHSPIGAVRFKAATEAGRTRDRSLVPDLIPLLDDEDPSVRLAAGTALEEITGHRTGYLAYAPKEERVRQMATWRAWWASQGPRPAAPSGPGGGTNVRHP